MPRTERCVRGREIGANTDKIPGKWGRGGHPPLSLWFERVHREPHWRGHLGERLYIHMFRGSVLGHSESCRKQLPVPSLDGGDLRAGVREPSAHTPRHRAAAQCLRPQRGQAAPSPCINLSLSPCRLPSHRRRPQLPAAPHPPRTEGWKTRTTSSVTPPSPAHLDLSQKSPAHGSLGLIGQSWVT